MKWKIKIFFLGLVIPFFQSSCRTENEMPLELKISEADQNNFNSQWEYEELWYPSGSLKSVTAYNGDEVVFIREYYPTGRLRVETPFKFGRREGFEKVYYSSGEMNIQRPYLRGKIHGTEKVFDEKGRTVSNKNYVHGIAVDSVLEEPMQVGETSEKSLERPADKSAPTRLNTSNSKVKGVKEGVVKEFYSSGEIKWEYTYHKGVKHGLAKRYSRSGHLIKKVYFNENGSRKILYDATK